MNQVRKQKLPGIEAIQYKGCLCIELEDLWTALHNSFNSAQTREIDIYILDDIPSKPTEEQNFFAKQEVSQIRYSLVVILELNGVSEVQYKDVMMIDDGKYQ